MKCNYCWGRRQRASSVAIARSRRIAWHNVSLSQQLEPRQASYVSIFVSAGLKGSKSSNRVPYIWLLAGVIPAQAGEACAYNVV